ncbi:hypothetical protein COB64_00420 [Candidatus Wolfebacteria bacterium]|nr:MAG: hypothetical protein COB64_00420 [Candidatus Wolfebacteria bacterium]
MTETKLKKENMYIKNRLSALSPIFHKMALGDFSFDIDIPEKEDEFTELLVTLDLMKDDINELVRELATSEKELEEKVKNRTDELHQKIIKIDLLNENLKDSQHATLNILEDLNEEKEKVEQKVKDQTKDLKEEKDKIETIIESIGDGVFVIDPEFKIILFNKAATLISGLSTKSVLGKRYKDTLKFVFEENEKISDDFVKEAMIASKIIEISNHTVLIKKDGSKVPVAGKVAPIKNKKGKIIGCVIAFRDVTKEREIDRAKTEFVSLASHQLRTPLSTINWYAEMLLEGDIGKIDSGQKNYLEKIYRNNKRMVALVDALLNVSRIELGTLAMDLKSIDIQKASEDLISEFIPQIRNKKIKIKTNYDKDLPHIHTDLKFIRIIFQNLLSNSIKYTPADGEILLTIEKSNSHILITVSDTGYGIPENQESMIFTKLFRADNVKEYDTDGTGLGLYIVKSIVRQLKGKIWFDSLMFTRVVAGKKERYGTKFYVSLPIDIMEKEKEPRGVG